MKKIPLTRRRSMVYVERGSLIQKKGEVLIVREEGETPLPLRRVASLLLGPGTTVTHAVVKQCADSKCYLIWTGTDGSKIYGAYGTQYTKPQKMFKQMEIHKNPEKRLSAARRLFERQFGVETDSKSVESLRGKEGSMMRSLYTDLAEKYQIPWQGRHVRGSWGESGTVNMFLSMSNGWLYSMIEAVLLTLGYSPAIGVVHANKPRSFVYDIADIYKTQHTIPFVFQMLRDFPAITRPEFQRKFMRLVEREKILVQAVGAVQYVLGEGGSLDTGSDAR